VVSLDEDVRSMPQLSSLNSVGSNNQFDELVRDGQLESATIAKPPVPSLAS
jgi:hypothetical protein